MRISVDRVNARECTSSNLQKLDLTLPVTSDILHFLHGVPYLELAQRSPGSSYGGGPLGLLHKGAQGGRRCPSCVSWLIHQLLLHSSTAPGCSLPWLLASCLADDRVRECLVCSAAAKSRISGVANNTEYNLRRSALLLVGLRSVGLWLGSGRQASPDTPLA